MRVKEVFSLVNEAAYDSMVLAMKKQFPADVSVIDRELAWAKTNLKKRDRIEWFLTIFKRLLTRTWDSNHENHGYRSFENFKDTLLHYYSFNDPNIERFVFNNKLEIRDVFKKFSEFEDSWIKRQTNKGVQIKEGDYKLFEFPDGTVWWFVNRAYCSDEARSGQHCGNVVGQQKVNQRILSLRNANNQVILTFILEPDKTLGEMKAKGNQKPAAAYHPQIMKLLMWDNIKGITGQGYLPDANFSVFDLNDRYLKYLDQHKPKLIVDQVNITPFELLKAPEWAKVKYGKTIAEKREVLGTVLLNPSEQAWHELLTANIQYAVYAPPALPNYEKYIIEAFKENDYPEELFLRSPNAITKNVPLVKSIIQIAPRVIRAISPTNKNFEAYAEIAITNNWNVTKFILEHMSQKLWWIAIGASKGILWNKMPRDLETNEMFKHAILSGNDELLKDLPSELRNDKEFAQQMMTRYPETYSNFVKELWDVDAIKQSILLGFTNSVNDLPLSEWTPEFINTAIKETPGIIVRLPKQLQTRENWKKAIAERVNLVLQLPKDLDIWDQDFVNWLVEEKLIPIRRQGFVTIIPNKYVTDEVFYKLITSVGKETLNFFGELYQLISEISGEKPEILTKERLQYLAKNLPLSISGLSRDVVEQNPEILKMAMETDPNLVYKFNRSYFITDDVVKIAVKTNPDYWDAINDALLADPSDSTAEKIIHFGKVAVRTNPKVKRYMESRLYKVLFPKEYDDIYNSITKDQNPSQTENLVRIIELSKKILK